MKIRNENKSPWKGDTLDKLVGAHVKYENFRWANDGEVLQAGGNTTVEYPKSVASVSSDSVDGNESTAVDAMSVGTVEFPVRVGLQKYKTWLRPMWKTTEIHRFLFRLRTISPRLYHYH